MALLLGVLLGRHNRGEAAPLWLTAGNVAFLCAVVAVFARPALGFELSAALAIGGAYAGICLSFCAVLVTENIRPPFGLLAIIGAAALSVQTFLAFRVDSATPLMVTSSVINGMLTTWMAHRVWQVVGPRGARVALLVALPFGAIAFGYLARLPAIAVDPGGVAPMAMTVLIIMIMSWSALILELGVLASVERAATARLTDALAKAEHLTKANARERFLLSMSHELRTPLNGVIGLSALMRAQAAGPLPERYAAFADSIHSSGVRLLDLISNLLDILAPEEAARQGRFADTCIASVFAEVEEASKPLCWPQGVRMTIDLPHGARPWARADRRRLVRMLRQLVENGIKYGRSNVTIGCTAAAAGKWAISVTDDGPGLRGEEIPEALELFGRVRGVDDPNAGAGVGLTLAAAIARAHGCELSFREGAEGGLCVEFLLPKCAGSTDRKTDDETGAARLIRRTEAGLPARSSFENYVAK